MFSRASAFNQDLSKWDDVSAVTDMVSMFSRASAFNQDLSKWDDVSAVTDMHGVHVLACIGLQPGPVQVGRVGRH
jgi:surface protein